MRHPFAPQRLAPLGLASFCLAFTSNCLAQTPQTTLSIQLDKPLHAVSPSLYGLMTEEINYSYDGGLYAEMVRNRSFLEGTWAGIEHWTLVNQGASEAAMDVDKTTGPSEALSRSLRLDATKADPQHQPGISNDGFWGMALRPNTTYKGSFYAKAKDPSVGPVEFSLLSDQTGKPVASVTSEPLTTEWKKYEFTLRTGGDLTPSAENHLRLTVGHPGTVWFSLVSLFPPTYKDRANGNRIDLMEKMAAMHPKFLRMPGGNYLEGDTVDERFDWKATIGPLVDRPTHRSPWNYQSSDGLGLLEFLEWTEDLKIDPLLAVYAGYSLKGAHVPPGPALEPYVQDALDEIEFVNGDVSTRWGGVRAKLGHPQPFPLHFVEIGNEDWFDKSGSYEGRYKQFYTAIKAKYPQLQLIATTPVKSIRPDVIDDHYYKRADEFFSFVKHYDDADRNGPKIFVGEWATREGIPTTNFGAALGDAAWMTAMERNSDLIVMSSYAPMLVNVNPGGMQWESDLIGYDTLTSYGSPGYYAQSIFAEYLGTEVPVSQMTGAPDRLFYSVTRDAAKGMVYLKLVNANTTPQETKIDLTGAGHIAGAGTLVRLSGTGPAETNDINAPTRIVPVKTTLNGVGASFSHTVPANTIEVLVLSTK